MYEGHFKQMEKKMEILSVISFVFIVTSLVIIMTPGQDMVLVMSRSISQGQGAGVMTALGVSCGLLGHTVLATLGLGALLLASEMLFTIIKFIGAGYLIYLGYGLLTSPEHKLAMKDMPKISYKKMFLQGVISNISNPKITIFYFSYLPQFLVADEESHTFQFFILGTTFAVVTFFIKGPIGFIAGMLASYIKSNPKFLGGIHKVSGVVLIGLGIKLAFEERA